jgi:hypothetical protein
MSLYLRYAPPQIHIKCLITSIIFVENTSSEDPFGVIFCIGRFLLVSFLQFCLSGLVP